MRALIILWSLKAIKQSWGLQKLSSASHRWRNLLAQKSIVSTSFSLSAVLCCPLTQGIVLFSADNVTLSVHVHGFSVEFCRPESLSERY